MEDTSKQIQKRPNVDDTSKQIQKITNVDDKSILLVHMSEISILIVYKKKIL